MDDIFKFTIDTFGFSSSHAFAPTWIQQIVRMNSYWNELLDSFDPDSFFESFASHCNELGLNYNSYSILNGFEKAKCEWRIELMIGISNNIAHFYTEGYKSDEVLVYWNDQAKQVQLVSDIKVRELNECPCTFLL